MIYKWILPLLFCLLFCFSFARQKPAETQATLVFTHAAIIDTSGGPNETDMTVFITGGRITDIEPSAKVPLPKGAHVIDAAGKYLIPGLWDMHVHSGGFRTTSGIPSWPPCLSGGTTSVPLPVRSVSG